MHLDIARMGIWFMVFLFSVTAHEAAHAWVGNWGGDPASQQGGHVTLDPLVHIRRSPFGMVVMPLLSFVMWGWMMGWASVPVDPRWGRRFPRKQALMSLAGPAANFALAGLGLAALRVLLAAGLVEPRLAGFGGLVSAAPPHSADSWVGAVALGLSVLVDLNVILGVFNLLPVPPLDGGNALEGLFPKTIGRLFERMRTVPVLSLVSLVAAWRLFPWLIRPWRDGPWAAWLLGA